MVKSITLEITGDQRLACAGCEQRVERLLKTLPGVRQVRAKAPAQTIEVLFDSAVLDPDAIAQRIGKAGYQTKVRSSTTGDAS